MQVWHVDTILRNLKSLHSDSTPYIECHFSGSVSDSWRPPANPCSLIDALVSQLSAKIHFIFFTQYPEDSMQSPNITCSLYLVKFGRLICGLSNGELAVISATQAATKLLLQSRRFSRSNESETFKSVT